MKTKMSKIVSVLLCLVMLLGMFQMTALAIDNSGNNSGNNSTYVPDDLIVNEPPVQNQYRETVVIVIGAQEEPVEEDNPDTGAPVFVGAVVGALAAAK